MIHFHLLMSHMQLCNPWVSQYGMHFPARHCPLSRQFVPSGIGGLLGQSAELPVHRDSCSQVAYWASLHFSPVFMNLQLWQHGEFLSLFIRYRTQVTVNHAMTTVTHRKQWIQTCKQPLDFYEVCSFYHSSCHYLQFQEDLHHILHLLPLVNSHRMILRAQRNNVQIWLEGLSE